jgi:hypothetical protein
MSVSFTPNIEPAGYKVSCAFDHTVHPTREQARDAVVAHGPRCAALEAWAAGIQSVDADAYWEAAENFRGEHPDRLHPDWCQSYWGVAAVYAEPLVEVNLANSNARGILELLGYDDNDLCGHADADEFLGRVLVAMAIAPRDLCTPTSEELGGSGARIIMCGRPEGYHQRVLGDLRELAEYAVARGVSISWY